MSKNKAAAYRYRLIDEALSNRGRRWTFDGLLAHLREKLYENYDIESLSRRVLEYDITLMRKSAPEGFDAPIKRSKGEIWYADSSFSIQNQPLIEGDIKNLEGALGVLEQFKGLPHAGQILQIVEKLRGVLKLPNKSWSEKIIFFEHNNELKGLHFLAPIFHHIRNKEALNITYLPFTAKQSKLVVFHPFFLKEFNNRWFVIGFNVNEKKQWTLALDRILHLEPTGVKIQSTPIAGEGYFDHVLGVTLPDNEPIEIIKFRLSKGRAPYLHTKPLHSSQVSRPPSSSGTVIFEMKLVINKELIAELLSFGSDLEVLSPKRLRKTMQSILKESLSLYN